jgi:hypothetical protein
MKYMYMLSYFFQFVNNCVMWYMYIVCGMWYAFLDWKTTSFIDGCLVLVTTIIFLK